MAEEFVQVVKLKVDDSELRAAIDFMKKELGTVGATLGSKITSATDKAAAGAEKIGKGFSKADKEAKKTAKDAKDIAKGTKEAKKETDGLAKSFKGMAGAVKSLVAAYAGFKGVSALIGFGKGSIDAFTAQKKAELQLDTVLKNRGMGFASQYIKDAASSIQGRTTIGDEAMISGAAELATYVKDPKQLKRMMNLLADYSMGMTGGAELSPEALTGLATGLGKAFDGSYEAMRKKGFDTSELETIEKALKLKEDIEKGNVSRDKKTGELKLSNDEKELVKWLQEHKGENIEALKISALENAMKDWKGLAEEFAKTDEGKIQQLKNTIGDMREEIGRQLLPVVADLATHLKENLPTLQELFDSLKEVIISLMKAVKDNFGTLVLFVKNIASFLKFVAANLPALVSFVGTMKIASKVIPLLNAGLKAMSLAAKGLIASNALALVAAAIVALGVTAYNTYKKQMQVYRDDRRETGDRKLKEWQDAEKALSASSGKSEYERRGLYENAQRKKEEFRSVVRDYASANGGVAYAEWGKALGEAVYMDNKANGGYGSKIMFTQIGEKKKEEDNPFKDIDFEREYKKAMDEASKAAKGDTNITNIKYTNNITTDSDLVAKAIKENLRTLLTSQLNFTSRTSAAKALAI